MTYQKSSSRPKGFDYEVQYHALLALRCLEPVNEIDDFWLAQNVDDNVCGKFDDVIVRLQKGPNLSRTYCIQLKQSQGDQRKKRLAYDSFRTNNDFKLSKYKDVTLPSTATDGSLFVAVGDDDIRYVIFANKPRDEDEIRFVAAQPEDYDLLNTGNGSCFAITSMPDVDAQFLRKLYVFHGQTYVEDLERTIRDTLSRLVGVTDDRTLDAVVAKYVRFFVDWFDGDGTMTKAHVSAQLAAFLLVPHVWASPETTRTPAMRHRLFDAHQIVLIQRADLPQAAYGQLKRCRLPEQSAAESLFWAWTKGDRWLVVVAEGHEHIPNVLAYLSLVPIRNTVVVLLEEHAPMCVRRYANLAQRYDDFSPEARAQLALRTIRLQSRRVTLNDALLWDREIESALSVGHGVHVSSDDAPMTLGDDAVAVPPHFVARTLSCLVVDADFFRGDNVYVILCRNGDETRRCLQPNGRKYVVVEDPTLLGATAARIKSEVDETVRVIVVSQTDDGTLRATPQVDAQLVYVVVAASKNDVVGYLTRHDVAYDPAEMYDEDDVDLRHVRFNCRFLVLRTEQRRLAIDPDLNYHCFRLDTLEMRWLYSSRGVAALRRFVSHRHAYEPEQCYADRVTIIAAAPGMGKTGLMNYLAHNCPKGLWSLLINLNDHSCYFECEANVSKSSAEHLKYFLGYDRKSLLEQFVMDRFVYARRVCLFLDGFDEISPFYDDAVGRIVTSLRDDGYQLFVSTRPVRQTFLEDKLEALARQINPLTADEQFVYIATYYKAEMVDANGCDVDDFVVRLVRTHSAEPTVPWDATFLGVALQTVMIAKVYLQQCRTYCATKVAPIWAKPLDALRLYEQFIDYAVEHVGRKQNITNAMARSHFVKAKNRSLALYKLCAAHTIFPHHFDDAKECVDEVDDGSEKFGLIERVGPQGRPIFIHKTFAEYLCAKHLTENYARLNDVIVEMYAHQEYDHVRNVFDRILARNCPLHRAVLNRDAVGAEQLLADVAVDEGGRTALHLAASWGARHVLPTDEAIDKVHASGVLSKLSRGTWQEKYRDESDAEAFVELIVGGRGDWSRLRDDVLKRTPLDYAFNCGMFASANILLRCGSSGVAPRVDLNRLLYVCVKYDYVHCVQFLTDPSASSELRFGDLRNSLLHVAALNGATDVVAGLKRFVDVQNVDGWTPMHYAARGGYISTVKQLLQSGASPHIPDGDGRTPLTYAAMTYNAVPLVTLLVDGGASTATVDREGKTPLMWACVMGRNAGVEALLVGGADVNTTDGDGRTPLMRAASVGKTETMQVLLDAGADVDATDNSGWTSLMLASDARMTSAMDVLVRRGCADVNKTDPHGWTALHLAGIRGLRGSVRFLIDAECCVDAVDPKGLTALMNASVNGCVDTLTTLLVDGGADVNRADANGKTALMYASLMGRNDAVRLLLDRGGRPNDRAADGTTCLMLAAQTGKRETVEALLDGGACVDARNSRGQSAVWIALGRRRFEVVSFLLGRGASVDVCPELAERTVGRMRDVALQMQPFVEEDVD